MPTIFLPYQEPKILKKGMLVYTDFLAKEKYLFRRLLKIKLDLKLDSAYRACASKGLDSNGKATLGHEIGGVHGIDAKWFNPIATNNGICL